MARKPDIQYISQFYVPGSEAQVIEFKPVRQVRKPQTKTVLPQAVPEKKIRLKVDMASLCGVVVASVMAILLLVGVIQYLNVCAEHREMSDRVIMLQNQQVTLQEEYRAGYDTEEVARMAEAMGMVKRTDLETVSVKVNVPVPEAEPTWWDNLTWFCSGLFA